MPNSMRLLLVAKSLTGAILFTIVLGTTASATTQAECERQLDVCASSYNQTSEWPTEHDRANCIAACNGDYNRCFATSKD
jgi:hypothetical protein